METHYKDLDQVNPAGPFSSATHGEEFAGWTPEERSFMDEDTPLFTKADYAKMAAAIVIVPGVLIALTLFAGAQAFKKFGERAPRP